MQLQQETESYRRFYPRVEAETLTPENVAHFAGYLCFGADEIIDKAYVMTAGREPYEAFHT